MQSNWEHDGQWDTGNGAITTTYRSGQYPNTQKTEFRSYCGRESDKTWYEVIFDDAQVQFGSAAAAEKYAAVLIAERRSAALTS
jgi:hypothetical protein